MGCDVAGALAGQPEVYNLGAMIPELTLIVPFCAPAAEVADDAYRQLTLPGLERLLARAREAARERHDDAYLPTLPHERWLAEHAGLPAGTLPSAPYMRLSDGAAADTRTWACLQPIHIHAARDHLVMLDPAHLRLEAEDAEALRQAIAPLIAESGLTLDAPHPARWYLADAPFGELHGAAPQRAAGHNIDIWMHQGEQERAWRKFQNEVQMTWYDHPVNRARDARGLLPVNSVWLFGQGALVDTRPIAERMVGEEPFFAGLCRAAGATELSARTLAELPADDTSAAVLLDAASTPFLSADWYDWLEALRVYDRDWFVPAADALADGRIDAVSLVLTGDSHYAHYRITRRELAGGPLGWLRRLSRPRTLRDALSPLSIPA